MRWSPVEALPAELRQRWAGGRLWAARQAPYLATALLALEPIVVEEAEGSADLSAFPADRDWHVYLDQAVLQATEVPTLGFWLVHQVSHLLRHHADRYPLADNESGLPPSARGNPGQRRWNLAADAEIDDDLTAGDIAVARGAVTPAAIGCPEGWVAEQYWDALGGDPHLPKADPTHDPDEASSGQGGAEQKGGTGQKAEAGQEEGAGQRNADCGSGCDGRARSWDCGRPGLGDVERKLVAREVAQRIREHSRQRGTVPAGWQRWADEVLEPSVSWQRILAAAVRRGIADVAGRVDFTYRRPSRRASVVPDVVLPSLRQPLPQVAMVLDTSGSMSDSMLGQALAEVTGVLRALGVGRRQLKLLCCDAQAYEVQRVRNIGDVALVGGGGTDMGAGLGAALALKPRPDLVIVLTDGFTPWPPAPPAGPRVIVGLMDLGGRVPPWAESVAIGAATRDVAPRRPLPPR
jgi:predicted metal-dependent peptidase